MLRPGCLDFALLTKNRVRNKNGQFKKCQNWKSSRSKRMTISKKILSTDSKPRFYSRWAARPVSSQTRFFTIPVPWVTKISGAGLTEDMLEGKKYLKVYRYFLSIFSPMICITGFKLCFKRMFQFSSFINRYFLNDVPVFFNKIEGFFWMNFWNFIICNSFQF